VGPRDQWLQALYSCNVLCKTLSNRKKKTHASGEVPLGFVHLSGDLYLSLTSPAIAVGYGCYNHATQFYKELFGPSTPSGIHMEPGCWGPSEMINIQENGELEKAFSESEIKETVFSMERNTAPGPDHFPFEFYRHCWDIRMVWSIYFLTSFEGESIF